ncbi:MAG: HD domain-containing protein [Bacteroidota bacterium]
MVKAYTKSLPLPTTCINQMKRTMQNPSYHAEGDVYTHTLMVLENVLKLDESWGLTEKEREILYWTALLHDIGKPKTTKWENGRYHSHGHEAAGVPVARNILLQRPELSTEQRRTILDLIRWHSIPLQYGIRKNPVSAYIPIALQVDLRLLGIFAYCDLTGRICKNQQQVWDLTSHFKEEILPKVIARIGTFRSLQEKYQEADLLHKNSLWQASQFRDSRLLEKLLAEPVMETENSRRSNTCIVPVGSSAKSMQSYLDARYSQAVRIELNKKDRPYLHHAIIKQIDPQEILLFEGDFTDESLRRELIDILRMEQMEVKILYFEDQLEELLAEITDPISYTEIRRRYADQGQIHPWEAHEIEFINNSFH